MKNDTPRGSAVVKVLQTNSSIELAKDYIELGIDALLESGALQDIPLVNTVVGIFNLGGSVRDQMLASKLLRFIHQLSEVSHKERLAMVEKLNNNEHFSGRVGAVIIEILDRMESDEKPELAAKCFAAYARDELSFEEFRRILFALERIPSFDIEKLEPFSRASTSDCQTMDEALLLSFVNAGLAQNNGGFDGGIIVPTKLCKKIVETGIVAV